MAEPPPDTAGTQQGDASSLHAAGGYGRTPRMHRRVIRVQATDSPNVQLALREIALGRRPSHRVVVPGVLTYAEYCARRQLWSADAQCIGLDANFWEGPDLLLYPQAWLDGSARRAEELAGLPRKAEAIGCDPAEGGDRSTWAIVDRLGLIELVSIKTPDTTMVVSMTIDLIRKHGVSPGKVLLDLGGGGKEHMDRLNAMGYPVKGVGFGQAPTLPARRGQNLLRDRQDMTEQRYAYVNRRAEMYHDLSLLLDPSRRALPQSSGDRPRVATNGNGNGRNGHGGIDLGAPEPPFAIPAGGYGRAESGIKTGLPRADDAALDELRRQMLVMPKLQDGEGRFWMLPKDVRGREQEGKQRTIKALLGGTSPDENDALCLSVHAMLVKDRRPVVGAMGAAR